MYIYVLYIYRIFLLPLLFASRGEVGGWGRVPFSRNLMSPTPRRKWYLTTGRRAHQMVLDPIPQSLPVHFFGSRPQPPTSRQEQPEGVYIYICIYICIIHMLGLYIYGCIYILYTYRTYVYYKYIMDHLFLSTLFCTSRLRAPRGGLALMYSLDVYTSKKKWVLIDLFFSVEWYFHCCTVVAQNSVNIYIYICVEASESV